MNGYTEKQVYLLEKDGLNCSDIIRILGDYQDRELPQTLRGKVSDHITECEKCRELEAGYRLVVELAGELEDQPVPQDVRRRVRERLNKTLGLSLAP